jgi:dTDP-4-dehydrorhamnose 3,5-epimerase
VGYELSESNHLQLWIPPGFAHGFLVLSETADFLYKTTAYYAPAHEAALRWDDEHVGVAWPDLGLSPILSAKDQAAPAWKQASLFD